MWDLPALSYTTVCETPPSCPQVLAISPAPMRALGSRINTLFSSTIMIEDNSAQYQVGKSSGGVDRHFVIKDVRLAESHCGKTAH